MLLAGQDVIAALGSSWRSRRRWTTDTTDHARLPSGVVGDDAVEAPADRRAAAGALAVPPTEVGDVVGEDTRDRMILQ
jgi:hypothetical protein